MTAFTCPHCGAVSYHPMDVEEGYCVRCHIFIRDEKEREMFCIGCANGNDLPEGEHCAMCGRMNMGFQQMLRPKPGFDWSHLSWGKPDSVRSALCSYCSAGISDDSVPLVMSTAAGYTVQFCDDCQRKWWGIETFRSEDDEPAG